MQWSVTTAPTQPPIAVDAVLLKHLRVDDATESDLITLYAQQAVSHAEEMLEMSLAPRTITATFSPDDLRCFCSQSVELPRGPVIAVTSVVGDSGAVQYTQNKVGNSDRIRITGNPTSLTVIYQAGFSTVPADILGAIRVHIATLYAWREDFTAAAANQVYKLDDFYRNRGHQQRVA